MPVSYYSISPTSKLNTIEVVKETKGFLTTTDGKIIRRSSAFARWFKKPEQAIRWHLHLLEEIADAKKTAYEEALRKLEEAQKTLNSQRP